MVNKYILDEILKLPSDNSTILTKTLSLLSKFNIELITTEKFDIIYRVKVEDILNSDIDNETLIEIRNGGWEYDDKNEYLIKKM